MEKVYILFEPFVFISILRITSCALTDCHPVTGNLKSCQCQTDNGFLVDLHKLFEWKPTTTNSMFNSTKAAYVYSYRPCSSFTLGQDCINVAACQLPVNSGAGFAIGMPPAPNIPTNFTGFVANNTLNITYLGTGGRHTVVMLRCSEEHYKFTALGETSPGSKIYVMTLETSLVCPSGVTGLSIGSIMCIVLLGNFLATNMRFFVLLFVYFGGGFAVMYFVKGARGTETIPNYNFWSELPGLIKDGFMFVARGCKTETDDTYQKI